MPSSIENFLNLPDDQLESYCGSKELGYAAECRQFLVENDVTKYNFCPDPEPSDLIGDGRKLVLVLDQTLDDASVNYGAMDAEGFIAMLQRAVDHNPEARIVVRTHPDVVAGRKKGYLQQRATELGLEISAAADNPIPWLKRAAIVYAGTSQLGYEALLCGCTVKVAGLPFYAGWGLTEDFQRIERRKQTRTLDQLFYASHIYYAAYCCPVSGEPWTLRDCLNHVVLQQRYFRRNAGNHVCVGITPWKRRYIAQFLRSPHGKLRFVRINDSIGDEIPVYWSYFDEKQNNTEQLKKNENYLSSCKNLKRIEDGFIRSIGLGSDFNAPSSLVLDDTVDRASRLLKLVQKSNVTKYNSMLSGTSAHVGVTTKKIQKVLLVVGQVEGDQSIIKGSATVNSNSKLLMAVRNANPKAHIVYRPHPDVVSGNRSGKVSDAILSECADQVETSISFLDCLKLCNELHTMTSLSGFEALTRGVKVVTYGTPFYAGWGLTTDLVRTPRRTKTRTLEELVFLTLAVYPHYIDLDSGEFITTEQLISMLASAVKKPIRQYNGSLASKILNLTRAMRYGV